jgi:hypothetical protein
MQSKQKGEQPPDEKNARDQVIHSFISNTKIKK